MSKDKNIIGLGFSKEKRKKSKAKSIGVLLPVPRTGNEKMTLMHAHIRVCGKNITPIIEDCISNVKVCYEDEPVYFKALMMQQIWEEIDYSNNKKYKKTPKEI